MYVSEINVKITRCTVISKTLNDNENKNLLPKI